MIHREVEEYMNQKTAFAFGFGLTVAEDSIYVIIRSLQWSS